jgi:hypothetical protein
MRGERWSVRCELSPEHRSRSQAVSSSDRCLYSRKGKTCADPSSMIRRTSRQSPYMTAVSKMSKRAGGYARISSCTYDSSRDSARDFGDTPCVLTRVEPRRSRYRAMSR